MRKFMLLGILTILFPFALSAQNIKVSGKVLDASTNEALVGVTVVQTGTQNGTITDLDGNFTLDNVASDASLSFSYIGYVTETIFVNGKSTIVCNLKTNDKEIDEVVVVGYGTQRKSDVTGSVASVGSDDMKNRASSDAAVALQGKAAGVQVLTNSGAPGTGAEIRVRGMSSNNSKANGPLLIVDGLKVDNIQYLDPEMIQSMEILKDAASAAIYGAAAGNGVVLITTKNGAKSKDGQIFYNAQWSLSSLSGKLDVMDAKQYIDYGKQAGFLSDERLASVGYDGGEVDWADEVFEPTWNSRHTIGMQGGNDRGSYFVALNYVKNDGIFTGNKDQYNRFTIQANGDYQIKKWLKVGTNNSIEKWKTKSVSQQSDNGSALLAAITSDPLFGPYCKDESTFTNEQKKAQEEGWAVLGDENGYYQMSPISGQSQSANPFVQRDKSDGYNEGINVRGLAFLNFTPIKGFVFTSRFGYRIAQSNNHLYEFPFRANEFVKKEEYHIQAKANTSYYNQWENFINYSKKIGEKHNIDLMVGMSFEKSHSDDVNSEAAGPDILKGYDSNFIYVNYVKDDIRDDGSNKTVKTIQNAPSDSKNISYLGRIVYSYDNKYSLQFNFRADAFDSSKLPKEERWGKFPSISAGWTISQEGFFKDNISTDAVSFLKLRGSWGKNGNVNSLGAYQYSTYINQNEDFYQYSTSGAATYSSVPNGLPNPDLKWEESEQIDLGLDARFLNSRLTLGVDWFKKSTKGLLVGVTPVLETGIGTTTINAGDVENSGLEIELGWKDKIGSDFHYSINANMATLKNEMTYLNSMVDNIPGVGLQGSSITTKCRENEPLWYFEGYKFKGVDGNGAAVFDDVNGDGVWDTKDVTNIGCGLPTFTYGITINLDYKGFDFLLFGTGVAGNEILPQAFRVDRKYCNNYAWFYENAGSDFPTIENWTKDVFSSDATVFKGDYFKIKQIQLGYTLPKSVTSKVRISNMRVFASLENFFTFTKYIGLDPETASANSGNSLGIDMGTYPTAKQVIFGVNISF